MYKGRQPNLRYKGRNGFAELDALEHSNQSESDMAEAMDFAHFVLEEMGSSLPSLEKMSEINDTPETLASVKERIANLNAEHQNGWAKLQDMFSLELGVRAFDRFVQTDDVLYVGDFAHDADYLQLTEYIETLHKLESRIHESHRNSIIERYQYDHLLEVIALHKKRTELERIEEEARINKEAQFPTSATEYRNMTSRAAQLHVARFLMADAETRERIRKSSRWRIEDTQALIQEYLTKTTFQTEIQNFVRENASKDPRSRHF